MKSFFSFLFSFCALTAAATGFFRVEQDLDNRWWARDPSGGRFVPLGVDHVKYEGFCCELENFRQHYREANDRRFGTNNVTAWRAETLGRLHAWGFNMFGGGNKLKGLPYGRYLPMGRGFLLWSKAEDRTFVKEMPNVFSPDFERHCREVAQRHCAPSRDDPDCFGYYLDNELHWWGDGPVSAKLGLYDAARKLPETHSARRAFDAFAAARGLADPAKPTRADREAFVRLCARRFFETAVRAIRAADPNHLVLGVRFAGLSGAPAVVWEECGKWCDVISINVYPYADLERNLLRENFNTRGRLLTDVLAEKYAWCKRPLLITEWSFPAMDSGLPCTKGAGQRFRTQKERTQACELFARTVLAQPFVIGYNYFMWVDQPPLGIAKSFPENSNYGLVRETGEPYAELTAMFARVQRDPIALRHAAPPAARELPPSLTADEMARRAGMTPGAEVTVEGTAYRLSNGAGWSAKGRVGTNLLFTEITVNGQPIGRLGGLVAYNGADGRPAWRPFSRIVSARATATADGVAALELTAEWKGEKEGFRNVYRIRTGTRGTSCLCELVSCENIGTVPFSPDSFYFLPDAVFALSSPPMPPHLWQPERKNAWIDPTDGRWLGALTRAPRIRLMKFWLNQKRTFPHSDAAVHPPVPVTIQPGDRYVSRDGGIYMLILAGSGGRDGWHAATTPLESP